MNETLMKAATKGRGKRDQELKAVWVNAFTDVVRNDPTGTVITIGRDGKPKTEKRVTSKKTAWAFEFISATGVWEYSTVLNLDKMDGAIRFTHTLKWCMNKLTADKDLFLKGTFDKCRFRLRNFVDNNVLMVAILVK